MEDKAELQADTTFENIVAQSPDPEAGMKMRRAETIAKGSDDVADLFPLTLREAANRRFQLG